MKRIILAIAAITAIAACTKSEVTYEAPGEITFLPTTSNATKGAMAGPLETANPGQKLGIYAFWNKTQGPIANPDKSNYTDAYLSNAVFARKQATETTYAWGGDGVAYPWPVNGSLIFAGYTKPASTIDVSYDVVNDKMIFTDYTQTDGFDLCWFGATPSSYNNRTDGTPITVNLSHALSWLSFEVVASGVAEGWKITSITLNDIANKGTGTCVGNSGIADVHRDAAKWVCNTYETDIPLFTADADTDPITLTTTVQNIEGANPKNEFVVIPQTINAGNQSSGARTQHTLTINYKFMVGASEKKDTKTVNLDLTASSDTNRWESGVHYTYTITFAGNEILVAPSYGTWVEADDKEITVE